MFQYSVLHNWFDYSRVCGQLRGYQFGTPDGFHPYIIDKSRAVDNLYIDGVSITYGSGPCKHIWTYANGLNLEANQISQCPCDTNGNAHRSLPSLEVTTTVRLVLMCTHAVNPNSTPMTPCGMDSSVLLRRLPAVLTPKCRGS